MTTLIERYTIYLKNDGDTISMVLTGVDVMTWLKVEHGAEPGMVQVRTRCVTF